MTTPKSALQQRIAQELALLNIEDTPPQSAECPEEAWMNGAAWMAKKIAQVLEEEGEDSAALLRRMSLSPVCLAKAAQQVKHDA